MTESTKRPKRQWTLMFYFASDNPLAPGIVSQLKALKNAGFHPEVNVIAQFDPFTPGTPTHVFDVNLIEKIREGVRKPDEPSIGFIGSRVDNPFVRNLMEDKLWKNETGRKNGTNGGEKIRDLIRKSLQAENPLFTYDPPEFPLDDEDSADGPVNYGANASSTSSTSTSGEPGPKESLEKFLEFCSQGYPAYHYMLFILGHGLVVGNDVFLFDEHTDQAPSLSLTDLGKVLTNFREQHIDKRDRFDLVSFHSCSMSSAEVAYELQGTANYMLASQSPAFVSSWPYRQILIRIFNDVAALQAARTDADEETVIRAMLRKFAHYCFHNSSDFILAGNSFDICLCSLKDIGQIRTPIQNLSAKLIEGLGNPLAKSFVLLAHLRSQSYYQESHTDLDDFCFCLIDIIEGFKNALAEEKPSTGDKTALPGEDAGSVGETSQVNKQSIPPKATRVLLEEIQSACQAVREILESSSNGDYMPILVSQAAGPEYQFAHGLSVFFPWISPLEDSKILTQYEQYKFQATDWLNFLRNYWDQTMRETRKDEEIQSVREGLDVAGMVVRVQTKAEELSEDIANLVFSKSGALSRSGALDRLDHKTGPPDPTGDDCNCSTIKNFPRDTRSRPDRKSAASKTPLPIGKNFFREK